ncbi:thioester reductase domain-containing protein [Marinicellulosiphila megalodicopiae]|uniref:thioester reductase domain-containing protein n=1 Tax=Marinicellulosiphila megalodicopiae TaxID=2724896 RepID=UPI003BAE7045
MKSYELLDSQLGIWLGQQKVGDSSIYNAAEYYEINGQIDIDKFICATNLVVNQADCLFCVFTMADTQLQQTRLESSFELPVIDLRQKNNPEQEALRWMQVARKQRFDLQHGPIFSMALIRLDNERMYWFQNIHHIASDGYSFSLLSQKVSDVYQELIVENSINEAALFGEYESLIEEQNKYKQSKAFEKDKEFWHKQLINMPTPHSLCESLDDNVGFASQSIKLTYEFSQAIFSKIQQCSTEHKVMWSDYILASVAMLIAEFNAQPHAVLGLPVMSRMGSKAINVPSMIMNIVPITLSFSIQSTFEEILALTSKTVSKTRPYFRYRYENMKMDRLNLESQDKTAKKLFGPVVNIMPFSRRLIFSEATVDYHNLSAGPVEDISFGFSLNKDQRLILNLEANPERYTQTQLEKILNDYLVLIETVAFNVLSKPKIKVDDLSFYQSDKILDEKLGVYPLLLQQAKAYPFKDALLFEHYQYNFSQLIQAIDRMVYVLEQHYVDSGQNVAFIVNRSDIAIIGMFACLKMKANFVFLETTAPTNRNDQILNSTQPALVIIDDNEKYNKLEFSTLTIDTIRKQLNKTSDYFIKDYGSYEKLSDYTAYLIFTSGSTGQPKGVVINQQALTDFVLASKNEYKSVYNDTWLQFAPLHFDACIEEIFVSLCSGAKLVVRNDDMIQSPSTFIKQCELFSLTVLDLPTAYWHELVYAMQDQNLCLPSLMRVVIIGGEAVSQTTVKTWLSLDTQHINLFNTYGPSEATVVATVANLTKRQQGIGLPLKGRAVAVVDAKLNVVPKNQEGELLLLGVGLADQYLDNFEQTKHAFIDWVHPVTQNIMRAYRTQDRVKMLKDNNIEFIGRKDDQVKISGVRIELGEIETTIAKLDGIKQVVVLKHIHLDVAYLVAHIVCLDKTYTNLYSDISNLRRALNTRLPKAMLPSSVMMHHCFDKTASGKVNKKILAQKSVVTPNNQQQYDDEVLNKIIKVWSEVLGNPHIKPQDDFFVLGGHSLQSIQVANRLSKIFELNISMNVIFKNPTVLDLTDYIKSNLSNYDTVPMDDLKQKNEVHQLIKNDLDYFKNSTFIKQNIDNSSKINDKKQSILLTGATGFVGVKLLSKILNTTQFNVICFIRAKSIEDAKLKLHNALAQQSININTNNINTNNRITIVLADLELENFGLDSIFLSELASQCVAIIHNAANTSVMRDYQSLRKCNAISTQQLLNLAQQYDIKFNLISTISVLAGAHKDKIDSQGYVKQHDGLQDGYQQSKWVSEECVRLASANGLHTSIYRLARVTGSLKTGYVNSKDIVWSILKVGLKHKALPDLSFEEPWSTVDDVAAFVIKDGLSECVNSVFNVLPNQDVALKWVYDNIQNHASFERTKLSIVSVSSWCESIRALGDDEDLPILNFFEQRKSLPKLHESHFRINQIGLNERLNHLNLSILMITKQQFYQYLEYAIKHKLIDCENNEDIINNSSVLI